MKNSIRTIGKSFTYGAITIGILSAIPAVAKQTSNLEQNELTAAQSIKRYVVTFKQNSLSSKSAKVMNNGSFSQQAAQQLTQSLGGKVVRYLNNINSVAVELNKASMQQMANNPQVNSIEEDQPRYLLAESTPYGITMVQADQVSDSTTGNMKVCIVDTGYDLGHEDLINSGVTGSDNDGNGNDTGNWYNDGHGHGSHVAGTISAIGSNNKGVVGVNPSGQLGLHIVKVFNDAGSWAYGSDLIAAISQCQSAGANIVSMSLGGGASMASENNAFESAYNGGMLFIAAAGNDGNTSKSYPASYDSVVSVAAVDSSQNLASFSQRNNQVEIAAPGVNVESTLPGNTYASWSGTSMATPHVSGVAALVWSLHPECSSSQMRNVLNMTAIDKGTSGRDNSYGFGIVQAKAAHDAITEQGCNVSGGPDPDPGTGETHENLSKSSGWKRYSFDLPSGMSTLTVRISGGTGDADLYVNEGSKTRNNRWDCRPYLTGNDEVCTINNPGANTWHIGVKAYSAYSGVTLSWEYQ